MTIPQQCTMIRLRHRRCCFIISFLPFLFPDGTCVVYDVMPVKLPLCVRSVERLLHDPGRYNTCLSYSAPLCLSYSVRYVRLPWRLTLTMGREGRYEHY